MPATEVASAAMIGSTTKIEVETVAGTAIFTELGEVKNAEKPNAAYDEAEVTHMGSPDGAKEFISGLVDYGEAPITMNWVPGGATDEFIESWREGGNERRTVKITTPNNKVYSFLAFVKGYSGSIPVGDVMEAELTLRVAGAVTRS